jgi:hypothetical protein
MSLENGSRLGESSHFSSSVDTNRLSLPLSAAGPTDGVDTASDRHLPPQATFRFPAAKRSLWVHDEDAVRRQAVDLSVLVPLGRLLLQRTDKFTKMNTSQFFRQ